MAGKNNIDDLFRENLLHRDFEFDPKHWEAAEKLIDAQEKKRKFWLRGKWYFSAIGIGAILFFAGLYFFLKPSAIEKGPAAGNGINSESKSVLSDKIGKQVASIEPKAQLEISPEKSPAENKSTKPLLSPKSNPEAVTGTAQPGIPVPEGVASNRNMAEISPQRVGTVQNDAGNFQEQSRVVDAKEGSVIAETEPVRHEKTSGNPVEPISPSVSGNSSALSEPATEKINMPVEVQAVEKRESSLTEGRESTQKENAVTSEKEVESESDGSLAPFEPEVLQKTVITMNKEILSGEEVIPEPVAEIQETKSPLKDRINWLRHISFGFMGGANLSEGFLNNGTSRALVSVTPAGGMRLGYLLNDQVDIETGIYYDFRGSLNSRISYLTSTDMGANVNYFSSTRSLSLHYLDFPVHFTYKYGKHSVVLGMHYANLIAMRNETINTREENGTVTTESTTKQWNRNDGRFSSFDLAAILGYEYAVYDRLKVCSRFNYGLFDVTDDNSFGNSVRDKNIQFRIMVDYRFVKY